MVVSGIVPRCFLIFITCELLGDVPVRFLEENRTKYRTLGKPTQNYP